jgi:hypothetical protein
MLRHAVGRSAWGVDGGMMWGKGIHHSFVEGVSSVDGHFFNYISLERNIFRGMRFLLHFILLWGFFNFLRDVWLLQLMGKE